MIALSVIIGEGVLDRFPKLRFVFLESGCGWLPYWFERMDEHYEVLGVQLPGAQDGAKQAVGARPALFLL